MEIVSKYGNSHFHLGLGIYHIHQLSNFCLWLPSLSIYVRCVWFSFTPMGLIWFVIPRFVILKVIGEGLEAISMAKGKDMVV